MKHSLKALVISASLMAVFPSLAQAQVRVAFDAKAFSLASAAKEPSGLRRIAETGLRSLIADIAKDLPAGTLPDGFPFDVNDFSELKNATLGLAYEVHTAHPQTILAGGRPLEQMLMGTGIWNFVVMVDGNPVALLELEKVHGKWTVNGAGGAKLAQDVHVASQNHSGRNAFRFVRIYQATADFLEVKDIEGKARYAPLLAARQSLRMMAPSAEATLAASADVLPSIQQAVQGHLAQFKNGQ